jgi:hypothetical protein
LLGVDDGYRAIDSLRGSIFDFWQLAELGPFCAQAVWAAANGARPKGQNNAIRTAPQRAKDRNLPPGRETSGIQGYPELYVPRMQNSRKMFLQSKFFVFFDGTSSTFPVYDW